MQYDIKLENKNNIIGELNEKVKSLEEKINASISLHDLHNEKFENHEQKIQHIYNLLFDLIDKRYKEINEKINGILKKISELKFNSDSILEDPEFIKHNQISQKKITKIKNLINTKTFNGHFSPICCIIQINWDRDFVTFATGSSDKSIKLWNADEAVCIKTLLGHTHWVYCLSHLKWNKDKTTIISGSRDMTLKLWNIELGICLKSINAHNNLISNLVQIRNDYLNINNDNNLLDLVNNDLNKTQSLGEESKNLKPENPCLLATCSWDRTLKIWNLEDGSLIKTLKGHRDSVRCVAQMRWKRDVHTILSGASDKSIKVWNIITGECKITLNGHQDSVYSLEFIEWNKDDITIASASYDKTLKIWDTEKGVCLKTLIGHTHYVNKVIQLKWEGEETVIISCSFDKSIRVWNLDTGKIMKSLKGHSEYVMGVCQLITSKDSITILSGSGDNSIKLWE